MVCCVTAATTTGSGPSGSVCATSCDPTTTQGMACNAGPSGMGVKDCPPPASDWSDCVQVSNSPAGLGLCIPGAGTGDGGTKDASTD
jgi:hypothetical protein